MGVERDISNLQTIFSLATIYVHLCKSRTYGAHKQQSELTGVTTFFSLAMSLDY